MLSEKTYGHALTSLVTTIIDKYCTAPVYEPDEQPPLPLPGKHKIDVCFIKTEVLKACGINEEEVSPEEIKLLMKRIWTVIRAFKKADIVVTETKKTATTTNFYLITKP